MTLDRSRSLDLLTALYASEASAVLERLEAVLEKHRRRLADRPSPSPWTQADVFLITYPDQLRSPGRPPLQALAEFCRSHLKPTIGGLHLLPFFPSSSDDGFAVTDYLRVDPALGDWDDIHRLGRDFRLMVDLVLNHASSQGAWFDAFRRGTPPHAAYFLVPEPAGDWSRVVRPRTSPLFTDFDTPPAAPDEVSARFYGALGLTPAQRLLLQPTRVVPRKRIELALELTRRLSDGCVLLVSHASGDEGTAYERHLRGYAELLGARVIFASEILAPERARLPDGRQVFSLADAYQQSALVTYPSTVEGFGNAFIETLYYRRPIVMSSYEIFRTDIKPKGFRVIEFEDFITDETVERARQVLDDPDLAAEMTDHNYELGRRYYSFHTLEHRLTTMIQDTLGMETAGWQ